ncbi:ArsR/SmtB family transcription factor [Leptolyngbya sp. 7M]|uniref:ArsR/SmtB family transcription factor n=1 Tax=Leptolyngbya sp. 7M TaxID=2812896 RepID=UPI001B8D9FB1|nr:metalloregulator ArsR/SmtB family transcription factor [Leptolyngbya sp. 7M]QYO65336.1 metalloregulator ArsR/SmtB family transcription factor [Leptolyngbya sp. 7M]
MSYEALVMIAERFRVLGEPIRLRLINLLRDGEMSVTELTRAANTSQPNVSKHLRLLTDAGVLRRDQRGNTVFYSIADQSIFRLCEVVCDSLDEQLRTKASIFAGI